MVVLFRGKAEASSMLHKVRKMYKFAKELKECLEDKIEDSEYDDDYGYDEEEPSYREDYSGQRSMTEPQMRNSRGGRYGYRRM